MAEFRRALRPCVNGFPQANMFHQPGLDESLLLRVREHPLISFYAGAEVHGLGPGPSTSARVQVSADLLPHERTHTFTGSVVLGCDGADSTVRKPARIPMEDMRFAERWLVVDVRARAGLDSSGGAEQVCGPSWSVTFMHVAGELYRWEFQLHDGEAEADLTTPRALGALLRPWTGRHDLAGLEIIRGTGYTFRAAVAAPVVVRRA